MGVDDWRGADMGARPRPVPLDKLEDAVLKPYRPWEWRPEAPVLFPVRRTRLCDFVGSLERDGGRIRHFLS